MLVEPLARALDPGSRTHKDRPSNTLGNEPLAEGGSVEVDLLRRRTRAVNVRIDDWLPLILKILRQVGVDRGRI